MVTSFQLFKEHNLTFFLPELKASDATKLVFEKESSFNFLLLALLNTGKDFFFDNYDENAKEVAEKATIFHILNFITKRKFQTSLGDKIQAIIKQREKSEEEKLIDALFHDKNSLFIEEFYKELDLDVFNLSLQWPAYGKFANFFEIFKPDKVDLTDEAKMKSAIKDQVRT